MRYLGQERQRAQVVVVDDGPAWGGEAEGGAGLPPGSAGALGGADARAYADRKPGRVHGGGQEDRRPVRDLQRGLSAVGGAARGKPRRLGSPQAVLPDLRTMFRRAIAEGRGLDFAIVDPVWVAEFAESHILTPIAELDPAWAAEHDADFLLPPSRGAAAPARARSGRPALRGRPSGGPRRSRRGPRRARRSPGAAARPGGCPHRPRHPCRYDPYVADASITVVSPFDEPLISVAKPHDIPFE
jgi:hypothetical protein